MIEPKQSPPGDNPLKWILGAVLGIGFVVWVANLGSTNSVESSASIPQSIDSNSTLESTEAALTPASPLPLDPSAARRGYGQFQMIAAAHVPGGSEIFSQNCYGALGKPFDWHQLDRCGAYDALAARWTEENDSVAGNDDLTYFQSEVAATRFLKAAASGGLPADQADIRWASLQGMALKERFERKATEPEAAPMDTDQDGDETTPADDSGSNAADSNAVDATD